MNILPTINPLSKYLWAGVAIVVASGLAFSHLTVYRAGKHQQQLETTAKALAESQAKAKEGFRRLEAQDENQRAQDAELVAAKAAAARNAADADRVREQAAGAAREWAARLADSPTREDLAAAGKAIAVCTDVSGRIDAAAGELAAFAEASRAAGLKCERDYDTLTQPPKE